MSEVTMEAQAAMRRCYGCTEAKPLDEFSCDRSKPGGRSYQCKSCKSAYQASPERREQRRQYRYGDGQEAVLAEKRRYNARVRQHAVDIYGGACAVCGATDGLEFDHANGDGAEHRKAESTKSMLLRIHRTGKRLEDVELALLCSRHHGMKTGVERGRWQGRRLSTVAELHEALEALLTLSRGRGVLLNSDGVDK